MPEAIRMGRSSDASRRRFGRGEAIAEDPLRHFHAGGAGPSGAHTVRRQANARVSRISAALAPTDAIDGDTRHPTPASNPRKEPSRV
jgi:predicted phage gp36 major capsid-like protein